MPPARESGPAERRGGEPGHHGQAAPAPSGTSLSQGEAPGGQPSRSQPSGPGARRERGGPQTVLALGTGPPGAQ